jgi:molybdate transport system regulatory protein
MTSNVAPPEPPKAVLQLRQGADSRVGPERIALLAAIAEHGSISAAARAVGLTYRGAWDAVQALNNLFDQPLVEGRAGGRQGGGAAVTPAGEALVAAFGRLNTRLDSLLAELHDALAGHTDLTGHRLIWSLGMRTSARNALRGVVEHVAEGAVNCEVTLRISPKVALTAIVTRTSAQDLDLRPGRDAVALVKSSFIVLAPGDAQLKTSARNQLAGVVRQHLQGAVNDEVTLELDEGKTLTATITRGSGEDLSFREGDRAQALIKASHIILAVD